MRAFRRVKTLAVLTAAVIMTVTAVAAQNLPKIAVYVTGNAKEDEKKALGTRMLASLANSKRYKGIERSSAFLAEVAKEHVKQRSGDIDDNQISALGKQFGVKFVCIADITPAFGEFQVSARIINVETAEVEFIGDASGSLKSMADLERISNMVVNNMFGNSVQTAGVQQSAASSPPAATFADNRDDRKYKTAKIGSQTWMAENLNYDASGSKCYKDDPANCDKYGRLYTWPSAKSACPAGWHLPSQVEWAALMNHSGSAVSGKKLKSTDGWNKNGNGTDEYGFSALPGGFCSSIGSFLSIGDVGRWWSATEHNASNAWNRYIYCYRANMDWDNNDKAFMFSVRCVQD